MRVAVYAIARDEAAHVDRFMAACAGAQSVLIADTGSSDNTVALARAAGAQVAAIAIRPWRFDDARNAALALVPADIDVCIALDLDEVLNPGWHGALARDWTPQTTMGRYRYVQSHLPDGSPGTVVSGAKIHARFGYRWRHMCHEVLCADRLPAARETWLAGVQVSHWPDTGKSRASYLSLLEAAVAEAPDDARDTFLLGREYATLGRWQEAEQVLARYLALPGATWKPQRAAALRRLARARAALGDAAGGIARLHAALAEAPEMRDCWLDLAELYAASEDWGGCLAAARCGLAIAVTPGAIANDVRHAGGRPYQCASIAAWRLGQLEEAAALAQAAVQREPTNQAFRRHLASLAGVA